MEKKTEQLTQEKELNVISFDEVKNRKGQGETLEDYFSRPDLRVTRGEFGQILQAVMGNIDKELMDSFNRVIITHNLVDVLVQALVQKEIINDADLQKAQETLVQELEKMTEKEDDNNGSK